MSQNPDGPDMGALGVLSDTQYARAVLPDVALFGPDLTPQAAAVLTQKTGVPGAELAQDVDRAAWAVQ